jgi:hypothetical protein
MLGSTVPWISGLGTRGADLGRSALRGGGNGKRKGPCQIILGLSPSEFRGFDAWQESPRGSRSVELVKDRSDVP